jgi:hypothetical protein
MPSPLLQPSLTAGEISPSLYARVDTARYQVALKQLYNFIVRPTGGVEFRSGTQFLTAAFDEATRFRLLPFVFSSDAGSEVAYVIELSHYYARFLANDVLVEVQTSDTTAYAGGTTYGLHAYVNDGGIIYRSLQAANLGNTPNVSPLWWVADPTLVVATPWSYTQALAVRYTQSNDVLYMANQEIPPQTIRRTSSTFFQVVAHQTKDGPFRDLNTDESRVVVSSGATGNVTLESNADIFTANSVGSLFYVETKNLGQIKPWVVGDRSVALGDLRRSDGKTYKAVTIPVGGTSWEETGNRQPVHESGRAWDGAGDVRTDGTSTWTVGVEWEYVDSGYGIVLITGYVSPTEVTGVVQLRLPAQVVGSLPSAADTWNHVGNGVLTVFSLAAPDATDGTYTVTVAGLPVQSDPNYQPPPASGGGFDNGTGNPGDTEIP